MKASQSYRRPVDLQNEGVVHQSRLDRSNVDQTWTNDIYYQDHSSRLKSDVGLSRTFKPHELVSCSTAVSGLVKIDLSFL